MAQPQSQDSPHLTETQARQGFRGRHALIVLIVSVILAAIVLSIVWANRAHDLTTDDARDARRIATSPGVNPPAKPNSAPAPTPTP